MYTFASRKQQLKSLLWAGVLMLILFWGLWLFNRHLDRLENYQPSKVIPSTKFKIANYFRGKQSQSILMTYLNDPAKVAEQTSSTTIQKAEAVPVLLYHGLVQEANQTDVLESNFRKQMATLKNNGWQTVGLDDFSAFLAGEKILPDKSFLLTFDDGRKDSYYPVDPILEALNYQAVTFIITGRAGGGYYLSDDELKKMLKTKRWEIQSHTKNAHDSYSIEDKGKEGHYLSNKLWLASENRLENDEEYRSRIEKDIAGAKTDLVQKFGIDSISIAFPFGDFGQGQTNYEKSKSTILEVVNQYHQMAFYQNWGGIKYTFNYPGSQTSMIRRMSVDPSWDEIDLLEALEGGRPKSLPLKDSFDQDQGWVKPWGKTEISSGNLVLSADKTTTGATAYLNGTSNWQDYLFTARVNFQGEGSFSLLARINDEGDYALCRFSQNGLAYQEKLEGKLTKPLIWQTKLLSQLEPPLTAGLLVQGQQTSCYLNGREMVRSEKTDLKNPRGAIGFSVWEKELGKAKLVVEEIEVSPI